MKIIFIDNSTFYHNGEKINDNAYYPGGVIIDGHNELCTNLTMTNCKIYENIGIGMKLVGVHNMSVERSIIQDNSWFGIYLGERGENITINHCKVFGNRRGGIYILDGTVKRRLLLSIHNILIYNNTIANNGDGNLFTKDGGIIIYNCINCVCIIDNNITSNNGYGVYFSRSRNNRVMNNNFINNMCHASFSDYALWNKWVRNYWDNWIGFGPKRVIGKFKSLILPWYNFDWHPAKTPYEI